ncbi:hypothetical protein [Methylobacterium nigriterrae]|uniref:hypothetical protein n=1 Tax=Methylobacterium nigriterrae TaxID=3127512 RepID=UPI0030137831
MDVVVTPVRDEDAWWLTDRLGAPLGAIRNPPGTDTFTIVAEPESPLYGMPAHHASLDAALAAIEQHTGGVCELNHDLKD